MTTIQYTSPEVKRLFIQAGFLQKFCHFEVSCTVKNTEKNLLYGYKRSKPQKGDFELHHDRQFAISCNGYGWPSCWNLDWTLSDQQDNTWDIYYQFPATSTGASPSPTMMIRSPLKCRHQRLLHRPDMLPCDTYLLAQAVISVMKWSRIIVYSAHPSVATKQIGHTVKGPAIPMPICHGVRATILILHIIQLSVQWHLNTNSSTLIRPPLLWNNIDCRDY